MKEPAMPAFFMDYSLQLQSNPNIDFAKVIIDVTRTFDIDPMILLFIWV